MLCTIEITKEYNTVTYDHATKSSKTIQIYKAAIKGAASSPRLVGRGSSELLAFEVLLNQIKLSDRRDFRFKPSDIITLIKKITRRT
jgi:hypothetical protein